MSNDLLFLIPFLFTVTNTYLVCAHSPETLYGFNCASQAVLRTWVRDGWELVRGPSGDSEPVWQFNVRMEDAVLIGPSGAEDHLGHYGSMWGLQGSPGNTGGLCDVR